MKKLFTLSAAVLFGTAMLAQTTTNITSTEKEIVKRQGVITHVDADYMQQLQERNAVADIWTNDFSTPGDWTPGDASTPSQEWAIGTAGPTGFFSAAMGGIASTSGGNFALFDSDGIGADGDVQDSWIQNTTPIDLSAFPNVLLQFESFYRAFQGDCFVEASANGTDWVTAQVHTDIAVNASTDNPTLVSLNLSSTIGGSSTAYVRFRYIGGWDYAWMVDDVVILEQLTDDLKLNFSLVTHLPGTGLEYGRIPVEQIGDITLGTEFMNFGVATQDNSVVAIEMIDGTGATVVDNATSAVSLAAGDTATVEIVEPVTWSFGTYTTTFELSSDGEQAGADSFIDNTDERTMAISNVYSIDGIDLYPNGTVTSLGTESFTDDSDEMILLAEYTLTAEQAVFGVEVMLNTNATDVGSEIRAILVNSAEELTSIVVTSDGWLTQSDTYEITQQDIDNGFVNLLFDDEYDLSSGAYYLGVELTSFGNSNNVAILDDTTVPQPAGASLFYSPSEGQLFTNGNAIGLRLMMDESGSQGVGLDEISAVSLVGQNVPNPAVSQTRIDFELISAQQVQIQVVDLTGKTVLEQDLGAMSPGQHQYMLDVRSLSAGTHFYSIITEQGTATQKMTVVK